MSRTPASANLVAVRGSTWEEEFVYRDAQGQAIDLTGFEARMQIRELDGQYGTSDAETLVMECTTANGRLAWDTAAGGRLVLRVEAADTLPLNPENAKAVKLAYAVELFRPDGQGEYVLPLIGGKITVMGETTR